MKTDNQIIEQALQILEERMHYATGPTMTNSDAVKNYLRLKLGGHPYEAFSALFLDNRHRVIEYEELFRGTVDGASVHPREVVKAALKHNAAVLILAHNHPSGVATPSEADKRITQRLKEALALVDVRVLDHIIVGNAVTYSFSEMGVI